MQPNINSNTQKERTSFATVLVGFHLPYVFGVSYYMHACMHAYIHTYTHTYIHTYIHTYRGYDKPLGESLC